MVDELLDYLRTREQRARIYQDERAARQVQADIPDTLLWINDSLLPVNWQALMPQPRQAFTTRAELVVTHGGISLEEVIVPFVKIEHENS